MHTLALVRHLYKGALTLGLIILAVSCSRTTPRQDLKPSLRISQRNEPADLDPGTSSLPDDFFIIRALSEGLVTISPQGAPHAAAAITWTHSKDEKIWTFHLRPNAKWSNGEPVTAFDFIESYKRVLTPGSLALKAELLFPVKNARKFLNGELTDFSALGFTALDPLTLVITLENPTPEFLMYVCSGVWIPINPRTVKQWGKDWTKPEHFIGNGPYLLKQWMPNQKIVLQQNPLYHDADKVLISTIEFIRFDDAESEERAYRSGGVDITMSVPVSKIPVYAKDRPTEIHRSILAETRYITFNTKKYPLNDPRVRLALSLALDRDKLVTDVLKGGQQPIETLIPHALWSAAQSSSFALPARTRREHNLIRAKQLMRDAGFPDGKNFPSIELSSWTNITLLEAIQDTFKKDLGIDITLNIQEARVHLASLQNGNYTLGLINSIPDVADPLAILENFTTESPNNYPHFSDPLFDQAITRARTLTKNKRYDLLKDAETRLLELAPVAPLYLNSQNWLMPARIKGWAADPLWRRSYLNLEIKP
ncbi:MAG: peptide ABC transporter substrate-binding protein [Verrucomicrobiota bacterium]|jgi:oligopeptide transport system substrate-binding protein|nr:MAG: peptide ABC transporter substrate-binding protein [Verrucomicrobiota bacterium]